MTGELYTTRELVSLYDNRVLDAPTAFLRDTFFNNRHNSDSEEVVFDKIKSRRKIAPFVAANLPGKARAMRGSESVSYAPPYVKPLITIKPNDAIKRRPGERLSGEMGPDQRWDMLVQQAMEDNEDEITRREEVMCSEILRTGGLSIAGQESHPDVTVDFGRAAAQTKALTSTARWGEAGVSPWADIRAWATLVGSNKGGVVKDVVLGTSAADLLLDDPDFRALLDNRRQAGGEMQLAGFAGEAPGYHAVHLGAVGQYTFWQYQQTFEDDSGSDVDVWPEYACGLFAPAYMQGWMAYGAILDTKSMVPTDRFPKMWEEDNPSGANVMTQSAPLPLIENVNSTFYASVR